MFLPLFLQIFWPLQIQAFTDCSVTRHFEIWDWTDSMQGFDILRCWSDSVQDSDILRYWQDSMQDSEIFWDIDVIPCRSLFWGTAAVMPVLCWWNSTLAPRTNALWVRNFLWFFHVSCISVKVKHLIADLLSVNSFQHWHPVQYNALWVWKFSWFCGFFNGLLLWSNSLWLISYHLLIHLDFCAKKFIAIITPIVFPNIINRDTFNISLGHFSTFRHTAAFLKICSGSLWYWRKVPILPIWSESQPRS